MHTSQGSLPVIQCLPGNRPYATTYCMHVHTHIHTHTNTHARTPTHARMRKHMHARTHTYAHIDTLGTWESQIRWHHQCITKNHRTPPKRCAKKIVPSPKRHAKNRCIPLNRMQKIIVPPLKLKSIKLPKTPFHIVLWCFNPIPGRGEMCPRHIFICRGNNFNLSYSGFGDFS